MRAPKTDTKKAGEADPAFQDADRGPSGRPGVSAVSPSCQLVSDSEAIKHASVFCEAAFPELKSREPEITLAGAARPCSAARVPLPACSP